MGLDLSLTSTGVSILGQTQVIAVKTIEERRLQEIRDAVMRLVMDKSIHLCVIEDYAFSARHSQAHKIGELGGVIRLSLFEAGIPFIEVSPTARAKFATGRGNAAKTEVVSSISARTGIIWAGKGADDMADAWVLEEMAWTRIGRPHYDWPKASTDALASVDWEQLDAIKEMIP
jgi:crossover junction endodeoxyribonuclease RuvC